MKERTSRRAEYAGYLMGQQLYERIDIEVVNEAVARRVRVQSVTARVSQRICARIGEGEHKCVNVEIICNPIAVQIARMSAEGISRKIR